MIPQFAGLPVEEHRHGEFLVSTDPARLDVGAIHDFLTNDSYWARGIGRPLVERAIAGSLCFGLYHVDAQVGFARVITDCASFAYLADVYVLQAYRGQKLGVFLVECVMKHPALTALRRFMLITNDAHGLYARFGFSPLATPERAMEIVRPKAYAPSGLRSAPHPDGPDPAAT